MDRLRLTRITQTVIELFMLCLVVFLVFSFARRYLNHSYHDPFPPMYQFGFAFLFTIQGLLQFYLAPEVVKVWRPWRFIPRRLQPKLPPDRVTIRRGGRMLLLLALMWWGLGLFDMFVTP